MYVGSKKKLPYYRSPNREGMYKESRSIWLKPPKGVDPKIPSGWVIDDEFTPVTASSSEYDADFTTSSGDDVLERYDTDNRPSSNSFIRDFRKIDILLGNVNPSSLEPLKKYYRKRYKLIKYFIPAYFYSRKDVPFFSKSYSKSPNNFLLEPGLLTCFPILVDSFRRKGPLFEKFVIKFLKLS